MNNGDGKEGKEKKGGKLEKKKVKEDNEGKKCC